MEAILMGDTVATCSDCRAVLPQDTPQGLCPRCALKGALRDVQPHETMPLPRDFGDYELLEQIARGGMGIVYEARQLSLNRRVAVKMILAGPFASREQARRFRAEAEAAARLQHPNIVCVHESGEVDGLPYFSMELVNGENLARLVRERPLTAKRAALYVKKVADAIQYAHDKGVLHRDLKPSNVLIDEHDEPRITDFGLAKVHADTSLTATGEVLGSPSFMPPEQASGKGKAGRTSDVYSLGGILFFLLTGRAPFAADTAAATINAVLQDDPISPRLLNPTVPRDLETICLKCLEKDPGRRYPTARELAEDLERWLSLNPIRARPANPLLRISRWTRRNAVGTALIAALVAGLAVAVALLLVVTTQRRTMRRLLVMKIEELWGQPGMQLNLIRSEALAALCGHNKPDVGTNAIRIRVGVNASTDPVTRAERFEPMLSFLERTMGKSLGQPVRADLALFKPGRVEKDAVLKREVEFSRMGALSFLRSKETDPGIVLLVQEISDKRSAIFVRRNSGITNISQLRGGSFGVADRDATISLLAKGVLFENGMRRGDIEFRQFDADSDLRKQIDTHGLQQDMIKEWHSHSGVLRAVIDGKVHAGVVRTKYLLENQHKIAGADDLVILREFDSISNFWVTRSGLDPKVVEALKAAMLAFGHSKPVVGLPNSAEGFSEVDKNDLQRLEKALEAEKEFENAIPRNDAEKEATP